MVRRALVAVLVVAVMLATGRLATADLPDCTTQKCVYLALVAMEPQPTATATATIIPTPTRTPTQVPGLPTVKNGDFEQGHTGWTEIPGNVVITQFAPIPARSGQWLAWLGGENDSTKELQQSIKLPTGKPLYLHFADYISADDVGAADIFTVLVNSDVLIDEDLTLNNDTFGKWEERVLDLNPYAGQTVTIRFRVQTDHSYPGNVYLDDLVIQSNP